MLENCDKKCTCPMYSPFGFVHLTHQNLCARALFCHNSLAKLNTQLSIIILFCFDAINSRLILSDKDWQEMEHSWWLNLLQINLLNWITPFQAVIERISKKRNLHMCRSYFDDFIILLFLPNMNFMNLDIHPNMLHNYFQTWRSDDS